ncbi:hypothetical protein [Pseudonocardia spinosispora]|uniref:hypothetical protein n=1 Tax=Pseudonocardia spinosispora TaxID=103441 RepID=UPI00040C1911|nr:hypothetical protein [Pseudonocardia spinosispora]
MTADHGDNAVPGRYPHRPDGDGRFEVVVRGYDRRQVDEYIANLELTIARQRTELEQAREALSRSGGNGAFRGPDGQAAGFNSGTAPARNAEGSGGQMIEAFTGRLQTILQEAHEEAEEIRSNAHSFARKEEEAARARITDLERRRDAVVGDLSRVRNGLDALVGQLLGTEQKKSGDEKPAPRADGAPSPSPRPSPTPSPSADKPSATPRSDSAPSPRPHPEPKPRPHPEPAPRSESAPRPHPEPGPRKTEQAGPPSPTPRSDSGPRLGQQLPVNEGLRPSPSPRSDDAARAPRPSPNPSPSPSGAPAPASSPQVTPSAQSKPRPSPSPRPRTTPPSPGPAAPGTGQRNGVSNQNGATATRDEEGGTHSAFGTGAR